MTQKLHREIIERLESGQAGEMSMEDTFTFECDDRCMGRCCNTIKIMLEPWDVESMARHLGMAGRDFIGEFCALEEDPRSQWPYVKLSDVEKGPCAFLMVGGKCRVYPARSRNCRTYPVGRAVRFNSGGVMEEKYFMVDKQNFCFGHSSARRWTLQEWLEDSGAMAYYHRSDQYFDLISYADTVLQLNRWMNSRISRMIMPFLYGPEVIRVKMGIPEEAVSHDQFYSRRMKALRVLLTELAAGFGFGPGAKGAGEEVEDAGIMDTVRGILLAEETSG